MANLSFEEIRDRIRAAVKETNASVEATNKIGMYPYRVEPAKAVTKGVTVLENYDDNKYYEYDFVIGDDGKVTLSNPSEVQKVESWSAVKSRVIAATKAKDHVLFTGTALVPGEPDCDAENGEELLTEAKVAKFAHEYMENYRIVDKEHEYLETGEEMGKPVESHLLPGPTVIKSMDGVEREYPKGTWVVKSKITDPEMQKKALKGKIFYSVTAVNKSYADKLVSAKNRVLIKDVPDSTVLTLALTESPCVDNSCNAEVASKSGRSISKQNKSILEKARDAANEAIDTINSLIQAEANNGGNNVSEKKDEENKEFVTKSDLVEFKDEVLEAVKAAPAATPPAKPKCTKCDAVLGAKDKFCPQCGAEIKAPASGKSKGEEEETEEGGGESKALKNHDDGKGGEVAFKSIEHYMGRNYRGRPSKNTKEE